MDVDEFSTGSIDPRADTQTSAQEDVDADESEGGMSAMDFTRDAYGGGEGPTANEVTEAGEYGEYSVEDFGSGVIGERSTMDSD